MKVAAGLAAVTAAAAAADVVVATAIRVVAAASVELVTGEPQAPGTLARQVDSAHRRSKTLGIACRKCPF